MISFLSWWLLAVLMGWLTFPIVFRLLPNLKDRGYGLARILGLLLWGYVFWFLTSLQILQNQIGSVLFSLFLLFLLSFGFARGHFQEMAEWIREHKKVIWISEALFLLAFAFWALIRAAYPEASYTEKPMELAFINSILRSPTFPPADPWLSGYAISYYYFGYVIVAMIIRVTGVTTGVAFNLGSSMWFGLTALAAYSILYSLLSLWGQHESGEKKKIPSEWLALLAPLFVLLVSNFEGFLEVLHSAGLFWTNTGAGLQSNFWSWLNIQDLIDPPRQPFAWTIDTSRNWWWWRASRVVQDFDLSGVRQEVIDEFPFFTYYIADLHPHLLAMPSVILSLGVALNMFLYQPFQRVEGISVLTWIKRWFSNQVSGGDIRLFKWIKRIDFWLAALVLGGVFFLNNSDFPIYLALFCAAYFLASYIKDGWSWNAVWEAGGLGINLFIASWILYFPYYAGFASQVGGILPSMVFYTRGVHFWVMFGPLMIPLLCWLIWYAIRKRDQISFGKAIGFAALLVFGLWLFSYLFGWLITSFSGLGGLISISSDPLLAALGNKLIDAGNAFGGKQGSLDTGLLFLSTNLERLKNPGTWLTLLGLLFLTWGLLKHLKPASEKKDSSFASAFVLLMTLVGIGLTLAPEFVYVRDLFGTRMNTIFKFYTQAWILWGIAGSFALIVFIRKISGVGKLIASILFTLAIGAALIYPLYGVIDRLSSVKFDQLSLDGTGYIEKGNPDEMDAIRWLQTAPYGVVVEAVGGSYSDFARAATLSGLPGVLGWPWHEYQWRGGGEQVGSRESDIALLYQTNDWTEVQRIVTQYNIHYIYVSLRERNKYHLNETTLSSHFIPVFQNSSVVIYETTNDVQASR